MARMDMQLTAIHGARQHDRIHVFLHRIDHLPILVGARCSTADVVNGRSWRLHLGLHHHSDDWLWICQNCRRTSSWLLSLDHQALGRVHCCRTWWSAMGSQPLLRKLSSKRYLVPFDAKWEPNGSPLGVPFWDPFCDRTGLILRFWAHSVSNWAPFGQQPHHQQQISSSSSSSSSSGTNSRGSWMTGMHRDVLAWSMRRRCQA
jgi:hypothetical protein